MVGECFGNGVIVGLGIEPDQLGVYFPSDGKLGIEYAEKNNLLRKKDEDGKQTGGYLDPDRRNIKTIKLRGEKSDGLFMPLESLSDFCDIGVLKEGDAVSILGGVLICEKYIPRTRTGRGSGGGTNPTAMKNTVFPFFTEHKDTDQLAYNMDRFKAGDHIYLTVKMHGTSQRTAYMQRKVREKKPFWRRLFTGSAYDEKTVWNYVSGTRRVVMDDEAIRSGGYYSDMEFRMKYHDLFKGKLRKGEEVFYEIVGYVNESVPIMSKCNNKAIGDREFVKRYGDVTTFSYGCAEGENDIYVYRMTMTNEDGDAVEYPWDLVKLRCGQMGVRHVIEADFFLYTTEDDLMARVDEHVGGVDPVGKTHIREGVVVRIDNRESFTAYKHKNFEFKVLEGIVKETAAEPDMEEAQELSGDSGKPERGIAVS
jgi:hypothetical protein